MKLGARVGVILCEKWSEKLIGFIGFGRYVGDVVPEEAVGQSADELREDGLTSMKFAMDSGEIVYECECCFEPEKNIREKHERLSTKGWKVVPVSMLMVRLARQAHHDSTRGVSEKVAAR